MLKDLIIPVLILAVITSVILPLPGIMVDFMLVGNIILALVLLVSTLYISDPLKLSALPSILLLTTLYRLALNISTTRLILSGGNAGSLIDVFGSIVTAGNLIVGLVVFLVITLIQFIVIAKGSERVAEVSARFTLDALPGKQMSIDADVRSGILDIYAAQIKRQELQTESRFYGALDGAMKFVKGDAIAGLVITAINIIGGFTIGVAINNLDLATAAQKFTLLTIGDGILSQIPALLNSLAAGMIVTRVCRGNDQSLGQELLSQFGQVKSVLVFIGILAVVLACLPGMPALPFITLACILIYHGLNKPSIKPKNSTTTESNGFKPKLLPILEIKFSKNIAHQLMNEDNLAIRLETLRKDIFDDLGILLKPVTCNLHPETENLIEILIRGNQCLLLRQTEANKLSVNNLILALNNCIKSNCTEFIDDLHTRRLLDYFEDHASELISNLVPNIISITKITKICKMLLEEDISIRQLDAILQSFAESGKNITDERILLEEARISLRRSITQQYSLNRELNIITLDPILDLHLAKAERQQSNLDFHLMENIKSALIKTTEYLQSNLIVVSRAARKQLADYLKISQLDFKVLAFEEITNNIKLNSLECISINNNLIKDLAA